jgi:hypothetical protein
LLFIKYGRAAANVDSRPVFAPRTRLKMHRSDAEPKEMIHV